MLSCIFLLVSCALLLWMVLSASDILTSRVHLGILANPSAFPQLLALPKSIHFLLACDSITISLLLILDHWVECGYFSGLT